MAPSGTSASIQARSRSGDLRVGVRLGALLERHRAALDDERVVLGLAVLRTVGDRQLDGAAQRSRAASSSPGASRKIAPTSIASLRRGSVHDHS